MTCELCEQLWNAYEGAVFEHVRLGSRHRMARAAGDLSAIAILGGEMDAAADKRASARQAVLDHEGETGHGARLDTGQE